MFGSHWHSGISSRLVFFSNKIQVFNDNEEFKVGFNDTKCNYVGNITRVERADYFGFDYPWFLWIFVKSGTHTSALGKKDRGKERKAGRQTERKKDSERDRKR